MSFGLKTFIMTALINMGIKEESDLNKESEPGNTMNTSTLAKSELFATLEKEGALLAKP